MSDIPYGHCHCGCGQKTRLAQDDRPQYGHVKGEPVRFVPGHNAGSRINYVVEDRGHDTACWVWQGVVDNYGYGRLVHGGRMVKAHRMCFEQAKGPIPEGLEIDHLCRNRACVNPDHLEAVTHRENMLRSPLLARNGHRPWSPTEDSLVLAHSMPDQALGELIGRTRGAVGFRRWRLRQVPSPESSVLVEGEETE